MKTSLIEKIIDGDQFQESTSEWCPECEESGCYCNPELIPLKEDDVIKASSLKEVIERTSGMLYPMEGFSGVWTIIELHLEASFVSDEEKVVWRQLSEVINHISEIDSYRSNGNTVYAMYAIHAVDNPEESRFRSERKLLKTFQPLQF